MLNFCIEIRTGHFIQPFVSMGLKTFNTLCDCKKTTPKTTQSFTVFRFSLFNFHHHLMELLCRYTQSTLLTVIRVS